MVDALRLRLPAASPSEVAKLVDANTKISVSLRMRNSDDSKQVKPVIQRVSPLV